MQNLGFVGLGVMGEPICRHLATSNTVDTARSMMGFDVRQPALQRLQAFGVVAASNLQSVFSQSAVVFLSLPGGPEVEQVIRTSGLLDSQTACKTVVDLSTTPVELTRVLAAELSAAGVTLLDAPVARTRQAAEQGTLATMVGGCEKTFRNVSPLLQRFASDVSYCGPSGCGQVVKILNNMVLFQTVLALAEAHVVGRRAGVAGEALFDALSKGSADSFALRNHGLKSLLAEQFPLQAFSTRYAAKDLDYALELAAAHNVEVRGAAGVAGVFAESIEQGYAEQYWPVLQRVVDAQRE